MKKQFGDTTNYTEIEVDGTIRCNEGATTYKFGLNLGIHYQIDTMGSRNRSIK